LPGRSAFISGHGISCRVAPCSPEQPEQDLRRGIRDPDRLDAKLLTDLKRCQIRERRSVPLLAAAL
jgi:hypothetical protein